MIERKLPPSEPQLVQTKRNIYLVSSIIYTNPFNDTHYLIKEINDNNNNNNKQCIVSSSTMTMITTTFVITILYYYYYINKFLFFQCK
jgi:hypothetical protein